MNDCFERLKEEVICAKKENHLQYNQSSNNSSNNRGSHSSINDESASGTTTPSTNWKILKLKEITPPMRNSPFRTQIPSISLPLLKLLFTLAQKTTIIIVLV